MGANHNRGEGGTKRGWPRGERVVQGGQGRAGKGRKAEDKGTQCRSGRGWEGKGLSYLQCISKEPNGRLTQALQQSSGAQVLCASWVLSLSPTGTEESVHSHP